MTNVFTRDRRVVQTDDKGRFYRVKARCSFCKAIMNVILDSYRKKQAKKCGLCNTKNNL